VVVVVFVAHCEKT